MVVSYGGQPQDSVSIGGLYLSHYLKTMENLQETFKTQDLKQFNLFISYIRAIITDKDKKGQIDAAMVARRSDLLKENETRKRMGFEEYNNTTIEFMVGFCAVEKCMEHLDYTLKISKRDVWVNMDQDDPNMPQPAEAVDEA